VPEDGVRALSARLARQGHAAITAVQFLTRLPLPGGMNQHPSDRTLLVDAVAYFPLVGALIGLVTGWLVWAAATVWPIGLAVVLAVAVEAVLTGAFHEDAVADCCDAFGGGWTREQVLHILKDSRVGSFGVLGLGLAVAVRVGAIAALPGEVLVAAVMASAALGRWAIVLLMWLVPPVPEREGLSKDVGQGVGAGTRWPGRHSGWRSGWVGTVGWSRCGRPSAWRRSRVVTLGWGYFVRERLGGVTGDTLGCCCYLGQCVTLLLACATIG
jgi:adenosylcobinamide-GDP ribazoletransferase